MDIGPHEYLKDLRRQSIVLGDRLFRPHDLAVTELPEYGRAIMWRRSDLVSFDLSTKSRFAFDGDSSSHVQSGRVRTDASTNQLGGAAAYLPPRGASESVRTRP